MRSESAQFRLLRLCSRTSLSPEIREQVRGLLACPIDWEGVWVEGEWHGVLPLVRRSIERVGPGLVPALFLESLRERLELVARWNLSRTAELIEVCRSLEARGVEALPFKGAVLAHSVYPSPVLREFSDLDILVRPEDLPTAQEALRSRGYLPHLELTGGQDRAFRWGRYAYPFLRPVDRMACDLHWRFAPSRLASGIRVTELWSLTEPVSIGGAELRQFSPEATLLVLCVHGAKHGPVPWSKLKWLCDVAELLESRPDFDPRSALDLATRHGCRRVVLLGLTLARDLLDARLPPLLERALESEASIADLAAPVEAGLREHPAPRWDGSVKLRWELQVRERPRDKLQILVRSALVPKRRDRDLKPLPGWLAFLYFPMRLGRLGLKRLSGKGKPEAQRSGTNSAPSQNGVS